MKNQPLDRRTLIKYMAQMGALSSMAIPASLRAATPSDHNWFLITAAGGFDTSLFCDPKNDSPREDGRGPVTRCNKDPYQLPGSPIQLASAPQGVAENLLAGEDIRQEFLEKHHQKMVVMNGIDTETVNHVTGEQAMWAGTTLNGAPCFGALVAHEYGLDLAMPFISSGGYDVTAGLVSISRSADNERSYTELANTQLYGDLYRGDAYTLIEQARALRLARQLQNEGSPAQLRALRALLTAKNANASFDKLNGKLATLKDAGLIRASLIAPTNNDTRAEIDAAQAKMRIALAAASSGLSHCVNIPLAGFDSHTRNDVMQYPNLGILMDSVNYLWEGLELFGIADNSTVIIGSDFGRTPYFNDSSLGKDHWPIGSMIVMSNSIRGNRVVGATDANVDALRINPQTLAQDSDGLVLKPAHIHRAIRKLAGIDNSPSAQRYALNATDLDIF